MSPLDEKACVDSLAIRTELRAFTGPKLHLAGRDHCSKRGINYAIRPPRKAANVCLPAVCVYMCVREREKRENRGLATSFFLSKQQPRRLSLSLSCLGAVYSPSNSYKWPFGAHPAASVPDPHSSPKMQPRKLQEHTTPETRGAPDSKNNSSYVQRILPKV